MINLIFTDEQYEAIKTHLFPGDGMESLAFCLATPIRHTDGVRFIVTDVFLIPHNLCERSSDNLTWQTKDIVHILDKANTEGKSVVKIHSHPRGPRFFSFQDNVSDSGLFPAIYDWCEGDMLHFSVVFTENFIIGRVVDPNGKFKPIDNIWTIGHPLRLYPSRSQAAVLQGFDESTYEVFKGLKVGVIGCSGTGGWILEHLGRNEVGILVNSDPDHLKIENLNRIVNSKLKLCGENKAFIASKSIEAMGLGTKVKSFNKPVNTYEVLSELRGCDVIFGCVDSVFARYFLNVFCSYYLIPYFDVGVHIASDQTRITSAVAGFEYIVPGKSSLQSRSIFTAEDLAAETFHLNSPSFFGRLKEEGYIRGQAVARPAVAVINCLSSSICFEEFQAGVLNYRSDLDDQIASKVFCAKSGEFFSRSEKDYPEDILLKKKVGKGDMFMVNEKHLILSPEIYGTEITN